MSISISLVINTLNEEHNITDCICSARDLVDEVVVADMHSEDRTVDIAKTLGAKVFFTERKLYVEPARNFAIEKASGDWILLLDADERLTPKLATELKIIAEEDKADVVTLKRDTYMFGQHIQYSGWQKDLQSRFFKKGFLEFPEEVHAQPKISGRQLILDEKKGNIQHFNYRDLRHFIEKINNYTDGEALKLLRTNGKITPLRGIYWGFRHFCKRYFKLKGYKDGKYGFILSVLMGFYWFLAFAKAWDMKKRDYTQNSSK